MQWIESLHPLLLAFIKVILFIGPTFLLVPIAIWLERRLLAWIQDRRGPNRVGPFGLLQPIADITKLLFKESINPAKVDKLIYFLAPILSLVPAFLLGGVIPWGPAHGLYGLLTPISNAEIGMLYVLASSSLGAYGVVLAGYAANNKYALLGGLRAAAQLISYELAMTVSVACVVLASGTLKPVEVIVQQEQRLWGVVPYIQNWFIFTPFGFVAGIIFLICMIAETNRAPFDLPEAENELIAGYHTEYSAMKFAMFFMSEYLAILVFGGVFATLFLGGYNLLPIRWEELAHHYPLLQPMASISYWISPIAYFGKCMLGMIGFIWIRSTLPRLRYDQLMSLGWKSLLPLATANFIVVAAWIMFTKIYGSLGGLIAISIAIAMLYLLFRSILLNYNQSSSNFERRNVQLVDPKSKKELTEA